VKLAMPEPSRDARPKIFSPSRKVTIPAGVPDSAVTVAVNVTGCPATEGFGDAVRVMLVEILMTCSTEKRDRVNYRLMVTPAGEGHKPFTEGLAKRNSYNRPQ
jgi:hypothetical protein